jgi:hypothetical protein
MFTRVHASHPSFSSIVSLRHSMSEPANVSRLTDGRVAFSIDDLGRFFLRISCAWALFREMMTFEGLFDK